jgi:hypothetical protein
MDMECAYVEAQHNRTYITTLHNTTQHNTTQHMSNSEDWNGLGIYRTIGTRVPRSIVGGKIISQIKLV